MKYVGTCDDIAYRSKFWGERSKYLLWEFESDRQRREIAHYQMHNRFYMDEIGIYNNEERLLQRR